jgi:ankyrin repeat protein
MWHMKITNKLYYSILNNDIDEFKFRLKEFLEEQNINDLIPTETLTPLTLTALHGRPHMMSYLLRNNIDINVNCRGDFGYTPLMTLCSTVCHSHNVDDPQLKCVKLLVKHPDVNINVTNEINQSALHLAAVFGNVNLMRILLNNQRISVNFQDDFIFKTALILAAENLSRACVRELLKHQNVNIHLQDCCHDTALSALEKKSPTEHFIISLLQHGQL